MEQIAMDAHIREKNINYLLCHWLNAVTNSSK